MSRHWFGDPADEADLGTTLDRLVAEVSRLLDRLDRLDRLEAAPVAPGSARVDPGAAAVVLPHRRIPGCILVVHVAEWSASVGCWWSATGDPTTAPARPAAVHRVPTAPRRRRPGRGLAGAGAVAAGDRAGARLRGGVPLDLVGRPGRWPRAGRPQPLAARLVDPRSGSPDPAGAGRGPTPGSGPTVAAGAGQGPVPEAGLLVGAVAAATAGWALAAATPTLFWVSWAGGAVRVLGLAAFALLLAWFRVAGSGRPARVRVPMLAGLGLATLGQAAQLLAGATRAPSPDDPAGQGFALVLRASLPSLLATAALACWLAAILGLPGRGRVSAWLPVAAGVGWTLGIVVGLGWLLAAARDHPDEAFAWYDAPTVALREAALAAAVLLLLAVIDRRPAPARPALAAWFGGAALLAVTAAHPIPQDPGRDPAGPGTSAADWSATGDVSAD